MSMDLVSREYRDEMQRVERRCELLNRWQPWLEYEAEQQANGSLCVSAAELLAQPDEPAFVAQAREEAHRSGYWYGYSQALDDLERATGRRSKAWLRVAQFFDGALTRWRYARHEGTYGLPPRFDPKA